MRLLPLADCFATPSLEDGLLLSPLFFFLESSVLLSGQGELFGKLGALLGELRIPFGEFGNLIQESHDRINRLNL